MGWLVFSWLDLDIFAGVSREMNASTYYTRILFIKQVHHAGMRQVLYEFLLLLFSGFNRHVHLLAPVFLPHHVYSEESRVKSSQATAAARGY